MHNKRQSCAKFIFLLFLALSLPKVGFGQAPNPGAAQPAQAGRVLIYLESNQYQYLETEMTKALPTGFIRIGNRNAFQQKIWASQLLRQIIRNNYDVNWYRSLEEAGTLSRSFGADALILGWEQGSAQSPELRILLFDNNSKRLLLDNNIPLQVDQWQKIFADMPKVQGMLQRVMTAIQKRAAPIAATPAPAPKTAPTRTPQPQEATPQKPSTQAQQQSGTAVQNAAPQQKVDAKKEPDNRPSLAYRTLTLRSGVSAAGRTFNYYQADPKTVSDYNLPYPFAIRADFQVDYFPLTRGENQSPFDLSLNLRFSRTPYYMASTTKSGESLRSTWQDMGLLLKLFWCPSNFHFSYIGGYRNIAFSFSAGSSGDNTLLLDSVPSTNYQIIQNGLGATLALDSWTLTAEAYYLFALKSGKVGEEDFPDSQESGWDISGFIDYKLSTNMTMRIGASYVNVDYKLNPPANHSKIAQSAKDQMLSTELSLAYSF